jgi:hypothetical protein
MDVAFVFVGERQEVACPFGVHGSVALVEVADELPVGGPRDVQNRRTTLGGYGAGLRGVDLAEQVGMAIEERAVDPSFSELATQARDRRRLTATDQGDRVWVVMIALGPRRAVRRCVH